MLLRHPVCLAVISAALMLSGAATAQSPSEVENESGCTFVEPARVRYLGNGPSLPMSALDRLRALHQVCNWPEVNVQTKWRQ